MPRGWTKARFRRTRARHFFSIISSAFPLGSCARIQVQVKMIRRNEADNLFENKESFLKQFFSFWKWWFCFVILSAQLHLQRFFISKKVFGSNKFVRTPFWRIRAGQKEDSHAVRARSGESTGCSARRSVAFGRDNGMIRTSFGRARASQRDDSHAVRARFRKSTG